MEHKQFTTKLEMCRFLDLTPVFIARMMPKDWIYEVQSPKWRGFRLILLAPFRWSQLAVTSSSVCGEALFFSVIASASDCACHGSRRSPQSDPPGLENDPVGKTPHSRAPAVTVNDREAKRVLRDRLNRRIDFERKLLA
jgi:hypothetical protein